MIRVFPRRPGCTPRDPLAFVGEPGLFRPPKQPVHISVTFTWDIPEAERLYRSWSRFYPDVKLGGPAFEDPGSSFYPGQYLAEGAVITSRGCPKECSFCLVPKREGYLRQGEVKSGWNVFDNNLLACGEDHVEAVFGMLRKQRRGAVFSGGLDAEIFNEEHARLLRSIRVAEMWFACDRPGALENLKKVAELLPDFSPRKRRCYVLVGYDGESLREAEKRCRQVYEAGFWPFAQLFRGEGEERRTKSREWSKLVKTSSVQTGDV